MVFFTSHIMPAINFTNRNWSSGGLIRSAYLLAVEGNIKKRGLSKGRFNGSEKIGKTICVLIWMNSVRSGTRIYLAQRICGCSLKIQRVPVQQRSVVCWKHFPHYWPFVRRIHWSPVSSPHKIQWCGALFFSLICAWINSGENNREVDHLRRHLANYDVIVMGSCHDPNIFVTGGTRSCCTWLWQPMVPSLLVNVTFWWHVDEYRHATLYFLSHCIWPNWVLWKYWRIYELMASQYTANLGVAGQTDAKGGTLPISSVSVHTYCLSNKNK